jgi:SAM-dependent MidA family methyltransferase
MELALYHPEHGFYATTGQPGRRGDFLTSPEVGPLFGVLIARLLDGIWDDLGRPDPFCVIEAGAGRGALAVSIAAASPRCGPALSYVMVERSAPLRSRHGEHLSVTPAHDALPPDDPDEAGPGPLAGTGPRWSSLAEMPRQRVTGVVLANELLDNLPIRLLERRDGDWGEILVDVGDGAVVEVVVPADDATTRRAMTLAPDAEPGARIPLQDRSASWVADALTTIERGSLVLVDYAATTTASLAARPWREWLRTYRAHDPGREPTEDIGRQDVTCEVAIDQLARVRRPDRDEGQAELLGRLGIDDLVAEGRAAWERGAARPDLAALTGRSRIREAEALMDPEGLGAFRVLRWDVG